MKYKVKSSHYIKATFDISSILKFSFPI